MISVLLAEWQIIGEAIGFKNSVSFMVGDLFKNVKAQSETH
jgi:hypothetical protein